MYFSNFVMMDEKVKKLIDILSQSHIEEAHVQHIFTLARKLIEKTSVGESNKYKLLKFYCDWTMHVEIDRSKEGAQVLARINEIIVLHMKLNDNSSFSDDITKALSLDQVREELNNLINNNGGSPEIFNKYNWAKIIPILAEILSQSSLKIGDDSRLKEIDKQIKSQPIKGASVVNELSIIKKPSSFFNPKAPAGQMTYCFSISTSDTTKFVTPLTKIFN